jgi:hypothetical protein
MEKVAKFVCGLGCLSALMGPLLALLLYPRANWLFAFPLFGIAVFVLEYIYSKDPTPQALADKIERLLNGTVGGWDIDNFEHLRVRDPRLRELWRRSFAVGGLPEEWVRLDEKQKDHLREVIRDLRELCKARDAEGETGVDF